MSSIADVLGLGYHPSHQEVIEGDRLQIKRLRWAFNDDDDDSKAIAVFLDSYESFVNGMDVGEHVRCSKPIADALHTSINEMRKAADLLVQLSSIKLTAQSRWYTDKDGPEYVEPSKDNPQDN